MFVKTKINEKEAGVGPFLLSSITGRPSKSTLFSLSLCHSSSYTNTHFDADADSGAGDNQTHF